VGEYLCKLGEVGIHEINIWIWAPKN
jgi:hypothetical protein